MERPPQLVNAQYSMESNVRLDLRWIHQNLHNTTYYRVKPHMVKWKSKMNKTVLFFPNKKIQVIGSVDIDQVLVIRRDIIKKLRKRFANSTFSLTSPKIHTMTWTYHFNRKFNFYGIPVDNLFSYEPELFPAAIFSHWEPIKVIVFPSGHANILGVKSSQSLPSILKELLQKYDDICEYRGYTNARASGHRL